MTRDNLTAERQAIASLSDLLERADKCQMLFELAHMALPEPLKRILGVATNGTSGGKLVSSVTIPPPEIRSKPAEAEPDWIFIEAKHACATSLVLAVIRQAKGPIRAKDVIERVTEIRPEVLKGSISNIGTRLRTIIKRSKDGWSLTNEGKGGILNDGWLWGPVSIFDKQDLAQHRRDAIVWVLRHNNTGLQTVQIVEQLSNCSWVHAPVNKDLLKADLEILRKADKIRRRGNTKKWEIVSGDKKIASE